MSVYDLYDEHVLHVNEYVCAQHNMLMFTDFVFIIIFGLIHCSLASWLSGDSAANHSLLICRFASLAEADQALYKKATLHIKSDKAKQ